MEISNEIKAKVCAQYLGQQCITNTRLAQGQGLPFKLLKGILMEIDLGMQSSYAGILLENEIDKCNYKNYSSDEYKLILYPLSDIIVEDVINGFKILNLDNSLETSIKVRKMKDFLSNNLKCNPLNACGAARTLTLYQFLQSRGYDLPQYLLKGKTLFEAGLAIYE